MYRARSIVSAFVVLAALAPSSVARAGNGGATPPPPCQQMAGSAGGDLSATEFTHYTVNPAPDATKVGAADPQSEGLNWDFNLNNFSSATVNNASVTVNSGLPASVFGPSQLQPTSFPISCGVPALNSQSGLSAFSGQLQETTAPTAFTPTNFTLGYSSERDVAPLTVPVGGGQQTVTARVILIDARYANPGRVNVNVNIGGSSVVSMSDPSPLNHGETLSSSGGKFGAASWSLGSPALNLEYDFAATINVANPYGVPWIHLPLVQFDVTINGPAANACPGSSLQVCIADPTLDGTQPNSGLATYAVGDPGHAWSLEHADWYGTWYPEQLPQQGGPQLIGVQPATVDSTPSDFPVDGNRTWTFYLNNRSSQAITNPTISVASGLPASRLFQNGQPVGSLPVVSSQASLAAGQRMAATPIMGPDVAVQFQPGYRSTRSITPLVVPTGGGEQTVSITVTPIDPAIQQFNLAFNDSLNSTLVSASTPTNLDQGESLCGSFGQLVSWDLCRVQTGKSYTFSAVLQVPNPFGVPFSHKPEANVFGDHEIPGSCASCGGPGPSVTIADTSLDGPTPGSGQVTWSVGETNHTWNVDRQEQRAIRYQPTRFSRLLALGSPALALGDEAVHATLRGGGDLQTGKPVTFSAGSASCTATTGSDGVATCSLSPGLPAGQYSLTAAFAGDVSLYPSTASAPVIVYQPTQFVIWGGNPGGVSAGSDYNFWGARWWDQVTGGDFQANPSFKGYADSVSGAAWAASPGASSHAPPTVASYIGVLVATSAQMSGGSETGAIGGVVILRVDDPAAYAPDPGHTGTGVLVEAVG
jgi:hypothetical protein